MWRKDWSSPRYGSPGVPASHCGVSVTWLQPPPAVIQEDPQTTAALTASTGAATLTCTCLLQNREHSARGYTSNGIPPPFMS